MSTTRTDRRSCRECGRSRSHRRALEVACGRSGKRRATRSFPRRPTGAHSDTPSRWRPPAINPGKRDGVATFSQATDGSSRAAAAPALATSADRGRRSGRTTAEPRGAAGAVRSDRTATQGREQARGGGDQCQVVHARCDHKEAIGRIPDPSARS
jgi:hypothetical protein